MGSKIKKKSKVIFGLLLTATLMVAFQNCGIPIDFAGFESSKANGNGTGYDGKVYVNHGVCSDSTALALKGSITVEADGSAVVTRRECEDLLEPIPIAAGSIQYALGDSSVAVYEKDIYDQYSDDVSKRKLTRMICWMHPSVMTPTSPTYQVMAWYMGDALALNANRPRLSSTIQTSGGDTTGILTQTTETYNSPSNVTYSARAGTSSFDLQISNYIMMTYGSFQSKINGVVVPIMTSQECYLQAPTFPSSTAGMTL